MTKTFNQSKISKARKFYCGPFFVQYAASCLQNPDKKTPTCNFLQAGVKILTCDQFRKFIDNFIPTVVTEFPPNLMSSPPTGYAIRSIKSRRFVNPVRYTCRDGHAIAKAVLATKGNSC